MGELSFVDWERTAVMVTALCLVSWGLVLVGIGLIEWAERWMRRHDR